MELETNQKVLEISQCFPGGDGAREQGGNWSALSWASRHCCRGSVWGRVPSAACISATVLPFCSQKRAASPRKAPDTRYRTSVTSFHIRFSSFHPVILAQGKATGSQRSVEPLSFISTLIGGDKWSGRKQRHLGVSSWPRSDTAQAASQDAEPRHQPALEFCAGTLEKASL